MFPSIPFLLGRGVTEHIMLRRKCRTVIPLKAIPTQKANL